ncbi:MAG TPA: alpha/beta hydrolase, partial [Anaerolineales bacterium]|nr:alpha/beta hydrolase [Anaerolineales bacterium]
RLGGVPCPDSDFTCVTLTVPLDHFDSQDARTIDVVFAILPATGERKGMFVTATGGPGSAGLASADSYTGAFNPAIPEQFDIVFFDQRGVGQSGDLQCAKAAAAYYQTEADYTTPEGEAVAVEAARKFSADCITEMGNPEALTYLGTDQAVEDLEALRVLFGDDKIWLYGESYGTQYAQTYAAAHPDHLGGLILDGTVDLTLSGPEFFVGQAQAFSDVLAFTLQACNEDDICAESMGGGDAVAAYNKLAQTLKQGPISFDFPLPSGGIETRQFTYADLENSAASYVYSESFRMIFLRALAAYSRNQDIVPMARILYDSLVLDPETLEAIPDPTYSDAVYYAVECQDYYDFSGTPDERAEAYLRAGDPLDASLPYFSSIFYGDMPCIFWPTDNTSDVRPAPLTAGQFPTLVLGAIADPATPVSNGQNVFSRLSNGYLVTQEGGPHVIYGRGVSCIDDLVTAFLVNDELPSQKETTCEGAVITDFVPLAPLSVKETPDLLDLFYAIDNEIYYLPEYYDWDVVTPTTVGCPFGGTFSLEATDTGDSLSLDACSFIDGLALTGNGSHNYDDGSLTLEVTVTGANDGTLTYTSSGDGSLTLTGEYGGEPVDLSR